MLGGQFLDHRRGLELVGGAIVIAMGVVMLLPRADHAASSGGRGCRPQFGHDGALRAGLAGAAFAIGWTPCIGPTLGAILTIAGTEGRASRRGLLLFAYSLGLAHPVPGRRLWLPTALAAMRPLRAHWATGDARVRARCWSFVGVLLATGQLTELTARLAG